jgi:hypothetical protein
LAIKKQKPENAAEVGHRPPETVRKFSFSFFFFFISPLLVRQRSVVTSELRRSRA